jgi:glycosyltransferase involved in cell wall biosynthesis
MWLTTAAAGLARIAGARVFLHHHSYSYVRERKPRMVALTRAAGPLAHHIVLTQSMLRDLGNAMPEIHRCLIIGNAGLVDTNLLELPLKSDGRSLVLGHLSNLNLDKGIAEVVDLAVALHQAGTQIRLIVAGPTADEESRLQLSRASVELGELFEYRGPLTGDKKRAFFGEVSHFIFPSRYIHEAAPLVLYEAMAAGVICVATQQGAIPEQLEGSPAVLAGSADCFVKEVLPALVRSHSSTAASHESRLAYLRALSESKGQLARFVALLADRDPDGE